MSNENDNDKVSNVVDNIFDTFEGEVDLDRGELEEEVSKYLDMGVPAEQAEQSILKDISREHDVSVDESDSDGQVADDKSVGELDKEGQWATLEVKVVTVWDNDNEKIHQTGLLADKTGQVKFTIFPGDDPPTLEEGKSYRIESLVTDEWSGNINVKFVSSTNVEELDDEVDVNDSQEVSGVIVDLQRGSGLIFRDEDGNVVQNRSEAEGETQSDLRLKAVLDDGNQTYNVVFDRELTESLTGMRLEEAEHLAEEELDKGVVMEEMNDEVVGRYLSVDVVNLGSTYVAEDYDDYDGYDLDNLLVKARGV